MDEKEIKAGMELLKALGIEAIDMRVIYDDSNISPAQALICNEMNSQSRPMPIAKKIILHMTKLARKEPNPMNCAADDFIGAIEYYLDWDIKISEENDG